MCIILHPDSLCERCVLIIMCVICCVSGISSRERALSVCVCLSSIWAVHTHTDTNDAHRAHCLQTIRRYTHTHIYTKRAHANTQNILTKRNIQPAPRACVVCVNQQANAPPPTFHPIRPHTTTKTVRATARTNESAHTHTHTLSPHYLAKPADVSTCLPTTTSTTTTKTTGQTPRARSIFAHLYAPHSDAHTHTLPYKTLHS